MAQVESKPLSTADLLSPDAVVALGSITVKALMTWKQICVYLNSEGCAQIAPVMEVQMDGKPEEEAISLLSAIGYDDERLMRYLKARDQRSANTELEKALLCTNSSQDLHR